VNLKGEKALKARIPVKLKKEAMAEINRLADREYQKVKDKEIADATRRIFKTIVFALHIIVPLVI
jgi:hypothetical protein